MITFCHLYVLREPMPSVQRYAANSKELLVWPGSIKKQFALQKKPGQKLRSDDIGQSL